MQAFNTIAIRCVLLGGLILAPTGCMKEEKAAAGRTAAPAAPVTVATVEQRDVGVDIRAIATVEPYATVTIKSRVAGQLQKVHVKPGQDVKAGELLFEIDPRPFQSALHEAEATLERDLALAKNAQVDAQRMGGLLQTNVATREEADKAAFAAEAAQATVRADQASVEHAKLQLDYTKVTSPVDGRAGSLLADLGNIVKVDDTPLLIINQVQPIYVSFAVPEEDLGRIRQRSQSGQPVVDVILPPQTTPSESGKLTFIDNQVDTDTGTIRLKATCGNEARRLWPGQFVQAILRLTTEPNAIVVPSQAVQVGQTGLFVFIVKPDKTVEIRPVIVRRTIGDISVIEKGLETGETVVTDGQLRLVNGAAVKITAPATNPALVQPKAPEDAG